MTVNRKTPTTTTNPGGISGSTYASEVAEEIAALWRVASEPLSNIGGTANAITADTLVSELAVYETGNKFSLIPTATNTTTVTINIDGLGVKSIKTSAGADLSNGELISGTEYIIQYDGTDFRVITTVVDLGAVINAAAAKSTPVDADLIGIADSADSFATKKVTVAEARAVIGGGLNSFDTEEPTGDVTVISTTGLSVYRDVTMVFAVQVNGSGATVRIRARVSGGTWRTLRTIIMGAFGTNILVGEVTVRNFGMTNDMKIFSGTYRSNDDEVLDRTNAIDTGTGVTVNGYSSYSERWDEMQLEVDDSFEGSTANERSYVEFYGEGTGA